MIICFMVRTGRWRYRLLCIWFAGARFPPRLLSGKVTRHSVKVANHKRRHHRDVAGILGALWPVYRFPCSVRDYSGAWAECHVELWPEGDIVIGINKIAWVLFLCEYMVTVMKDLITKFLTYVFFYVPICIYFSAYGSSKSRWRLIRRVNIISRLWHNVRDKTS